MASLVLQELSTLVSSHSLPLGNPLCTDDLCCSLDLSIAHVPSFGLPASIDTTFSRYLFSPPTGDRGACESRLILLSIYRPPASKSTSQALVAHTALLSNPTRDCRILGQSGRVLEWPLRQTWSEISKKWVGLGVTNFPFRTSGASDSDSVRCWGFIVQKGKRTLGHQNSPSHLHCDGFNVASPRETQGRDA